MTKRESETISNEKICQKCHKHIGGGSYYMIQLDCIFDGNSLSACERSILCSDCYHDLRSWLNIIQ
jgi:hypothetical protein